MTLKVKADLTGSFEPMLKGFASKTERGILRASLRRTGQQVVAKEARINLRRVGGKRFTRDIIVKTSVTLSRAVAQIGARKRSPLAKIGHLIEGGTRPHVIQTRRQGGVMMGKDGIFRGRRVQHPGTQARPWLNPALLNKKRQAVARFKDLVVEEMFKAIRKGKR